MDMSVNTLIPISDDRDHVTGPLPVQISSHPVPTSLCKNNDSYDDLQNRSQRVLSSRTMQVKRRSSITLDRLRFSQLQIHSRDIEQETIRRCIMRLERHSTDCEQPATKVVKQLVLISGESGTGKTALAMTLRKPAIDIGGIFAMGKYELQHQSEPYLGLVSACDKIFSQLNPSDQSCSNDCNNKLHLFRDDLCEDLGDGIKALKQIVPSIVNHVLKGRVEEYSSESDSEEFGYGPGRHEAKAKMHYVFRKLFRALCKHFAPVVVALDDLQWADLGSLELIDDLLSDRKNRHLMVIGLY